MKSGISLPEMAIELERRANARQDYIVNTEVLQMLEDGRSLTLDNSQYQAEPLSISDTAHSQIATRLGIPLRYYKKMQQDSSGLLAENVNHWLHNDPENRMIRTMDQKVSAFLSDRYKRIDHEEIAHHTIPILLEQAGTVVESCQVTDNHMYIKAIFTDVEAEVKVGDTVQAGVMIRNSEVGLGSASVIPFIKRLVCLNGLAINDMKYAAKHIGSRADTTENIYELLSDETREADDRAILLKIRDVVAASFDEVRFERHVAKMRDATEDYIEESPTSAVRVLAKKENLTEFEENSVLRNLINGADLSRYGLLNAVTRTSQDIESYDRATELEMLGGKILMYTKSEFEAIRRAA